LGLAFFGLTTTNASEHRITLFKMVHQIVFQGKGGYDFPTIYNLPIWLRKYIYKEITDFYSEEKKSMENAKAGKKGNKTLVSADGKVNTPAFAQESKAYKGKTSYK
jgi:hypothetical protein